MPAHSIVLRPNGAEACSLLLEYHVSHRLGQAPLLVVDVESPRILALLRRASHACCLASAPSWTCLCPLQRPAADVLRGCRRFVHDVMHGVDIVMVALAPVLHSQGSQREAAAALAEEPDSEVAGGTLLTAPLGGARLARSPHRRPNMWQEPSRRSAAGICRPGGQHLLCSTAAHSALHTQGCGCVLTHTRCRVPFCTWCPGPCAGGHCVVPCRGGRVGSSACAAAPRGSPPGGGGARHAGHHHPADQLQVGPPASLLRLLWSSVRCLGLQVEPGCCWRAVQPTAVARSRRGHCWSTP